MTKQARRTSLFFAVILLLAAAMILGLLVKEARAALVYGNGADVQMDMASVSVTLTIDGEPVEEGKEAGALLQGTEEMDPGYTYAQRIAAANNATEEEYVRIIVKKYWVDEAGIKQTDLDPSYIELRSQSSDYNTAGWILNEEESTKEQSVYYCIAPVAPGAESPALFDGIRISPETARQDLTYSGDQTEVTPSYAYNGMHAAVEIEVQSVQAAHAEEAIPSAWGVQNIVVENGRLALE